MALIAGGVLLISFVLFVLHIVLCVWAYRDSLRRGRSSEYAIVVLVGLLFFPLVGLIVYLVIRND